MTEVLAPCAGRVIALADVPDPVFAGEMVGPGVAIDPAPGMTTVVSPIAGSVAKVHPHAFVVVADDGSAILVHLGINTVRLDGAGFEVLATQGSTVAAGDPMVRWDPSAIVGDDLSPIVPIVALDRMGISLTSEHVGSDISPGTPLFTL